MSLKDVKQTRVIHVPENLEDRIFADLDHLYPIALKKGMGAVAKEAAAVHKLTAQLLELPEGASREIQERKGRFTGEILSPIAQGQFTALLAQIAFSPTSKMGSDRGDQRTVTYYEFASQLEALVKMAGSIPPNEGFNRFSIRKLLEKYDSSQLPKSLVERSARHQRKDAFWAIRLWLDAKPRPGSRPSGGRFQKPDDNRRNDNQQQGGRVFAAQRELERQRIEEEQRKHALSQDDLDTLNRAQLKDVIKNENLEIKVYKTTTDEHLRAAIRAARPVPVEEEEELEEEEEEFEEEEETDDLDTLNRAQLKDVIKNENLEIKVYKTTTDEHLRAAIRAARPAAPVEEEELEEEVEEDVEEENGESAEVAPTVEWAASVCENADTFRKPLRKELKHALKVWGAGSGDKNDAQFIAAIQAVMERAKTEQ